MDVKIKPLVSFKQMTLFPEDDVISKALTNGTANKLSHNDKSFHDWYRFVLSFPPHLVREYIEKFSLRDGATILDPFCGAGTTVVEAKLCGINSIGIEANPIARGKNPWDNVGGRSKSKSSSDAEVICPMCNGNCRCPAPE